MPKLKREVVVHLAMHQNRNYGGKSHTFRDMPLKHLERLEVWYFQPDSIELKMNFNICCSLYSLDLLAMWVVGCLVVPRVAGYVAG